MRTRSTSSAAHAIRELALSFPQTYEDAPWGFPVFKVGANKLFAMLIEDGDRLELTVKLTQEERQIVELLPWVRSASHIGRYGWVTATVTDVETLAAALEWLRESYWLKAPAAVREAAFEDA
ncbi:MAG TPA: MmcQ/YjbR family DNA-binding protein [Gaiellaceae bacterium]|nr:MmcQ/YjbR family DNA-binding protein [Gaiellaceae bacterium]